MAKQKEQKPGTTARPNKSIASAPSSRASTTKTVSKAPPFTPITTENDKPTPPETTPLVEKPLRRRQILIGGLGIAATIAGAGAWVWSATPHSAFNQAGQEGGTGDQLVLSWNNAALQAIRELQPEVPVTARALAIVHTCMFDAWTAYDNQAVSTHSGLRLRRPVDEHTLENKSQAVSFAAYKALVTLFPAKRASFSNLMIQLGYNPESHETDFRLPEGIGNMVAQTVLDTRLHDGANQAGDLHVGAYTDYSRYTPANTSDVLRDLNHWQPLDISNGQNHLAPQAFASAHWANVIPFALSSSVQFLSKTGPARYPGSLYTQQAEEILQYSARLSDEHKVIAEYWSNGPNREQPAGHWSLFAQFVAQRDNYDLDQNVKLFFALNNALLDASIACWAAKRTYDSPYPITAIRYLFRGKQIQAWAGPGKGFQIISGESWRPYQPETQLSPAYPEYCSEHSTFAGAAAEILYRFTGSDRLGMSYSWPAHSSLIEPGTPADNTLLTWRTFSQAANQAGLSGRYSGVHFAQGDLDGRTLGRKVGAQA